MSVTHYITTAPLTFIAPGDRRIEVPAGTPCTSSGRDGLEETEVVLGRVATLNRQERLKVYYAVKLAGLPRIIHKSFLRDQPHG